jgi:cytochrome c biogenesis protein CcdA
MIWLKSFLAGVVAVLAAFIIMVLAVFVLPLFLTMSRTGSSSIGAVSAGISALAVLLGVPLVFAGGFYWEYRRASRRRARS